MSNKFVIRLGSMLLGVLFAGACDAEEMSSEVVRGNEGEPSPTAHGDSWKGSEESKGGLGEEVEPMDTYVDQFADVEDEPQAITASYSGYHAGSYASMYYLNLNTYFYDFTNDGGDCTSFASQAILAGLAGTTDKWTVYQKRLSYQDNAYASNDWWYSSANNRATPEWAGADGLYSYLTKQAQNPGWSGLKVTRVYYPGFVGPAAFKIGDIVSKVNLSDTDPNVTSWCKTSRACHTAIVVTSGNSLDQAVVAYRNATGYSPKKVPLSNLASAKYGLYVFRISQFAN